MALLYEMPWRLPIGRKLCKVFKQIIYVFYDLYRVGYSDKNGVRDNNVVKINLT